MIPNLYVYDLETYPNCFLWSGSFLESNDYQIFEISDRRNDLDHLLAWLSYLQNLGAYLIGFNNVGFDNEITEDIFQQPYAYSALKAYEKAQSIFHNQNAFGRGMGGVRPADRKLPQIDLYLINHFNNKARATSLKALQFAMRSRTVEDLPFAPGTVLTHPQMDIMRGYNVHDISETKTFARKCMHLINMRKELLDQGVLTGDVLNFSDVKIGEQYLIKKIGRAKCYRGSKAIQTFRSEVPFAEIILPKIYYRTEPFQEVHEWFKKQTVYIHREERPKLETKLAGIKFVFGVGGVHASVERKFYRSNETHVIKDVDVAGMYVAVAIANGFAPEHLGQDFVNAYRQLQKDRAQYKKGTSMNKVLKLAGNGVYGKSNDVFSCFYDPKYTFTVTVNGQLQLIQLAEIFSLIPGLEIIQANTDGVTVYLPRKYEYLFNFWYKQWEKETGLKLEEVTYNRMWIRDVNNYLAEGVDGKIKRKGAYWYPENEEEYEGVWNKDFSRMVVEKSIEQVLLHGWNPDAVVRTFVDPFDFMLRYKTPKDSTIYIGDKPMSKTVRYYVSTQGEPMKKISGARGPVGEFKRANKIDDDFFNKVMKEIGPGVWDARIHTKNKSKYEENVETGIEAGLLVKECNDASKFNWQDLDYDYYANEVRKLII